MNATYAGTHRVVLDDKQRLTIPEEWRGEEFENELFAFPSKKGCVRVYPRSWLKAVHERLAEMRFDDPLRAGIEEVGASACRLVWDARGRVRLAENLLVVAGIHSNRALLIGRLDCFEIWDPDRFEARPAAFRTPEDIAF